MKSIFQKTYVKNINNSIVEMSKISIEFNKDSSENNKPETIITHNKTNIIKFENKHIVNAKNIINKISLSELNQREMLYVIKKPIDHLENSLKASSDEGNQKKDTTEENIITKQRSIKNFTRPDEM